MTHGIFTTVESVSSKPNLTLCQTLVTDKQPFTMPSTSPSSTQPNPWYHPLTMDLLIKVLSNSLLHPFIACLIPLCLRAVATPFDSPRFLIATAYAILLIILSLFSIANHRIAYGTPRDVNLEDEVIVITGGAGGLGGIIAEIYGMKGVSVAVLDVRKPEWVAKTDGGGEEMETVRWYECDVGDRAQVEKVGTQIEKDVCRLSSYSTKTSLFSLLRADCLVCDC